ncbi:MAG: excinuclease subunit [Patescibacteria group bacterium]|nr:excinuclease subunit [Patescibacteria group bacterium]
MDATKNKPDLSHLPNKPGVYLHKNIQGEVIYVGKAINLKQRVNQYWQKSSHIASAKTALLAQESVKVDYIETLSEIDALFLESELVKRYMPKFNIELRDDKSATYVRIPYKDSFPTVSFTRIPKVDGATYVGPFYMAGPVYQAMRTIRRALPYSTHTKLPKKPCLHFQLGLCPGPETDQFDVKKYKSNLKKIEQVLRGERESILKSLEKNMLEAAKKQKFELATRYRNQLKSLKHVGRIQLKDHEIIGSDQALTELRKLLRLKDVPKHIEGFDISHMSGKDVVASQVVFKNGVSSKTDYRHYKITNQQNNDFESMADVISRRFKEVNLEQWGKPDLLLIDGGKGQLGAAAEAIQGTPQPMFGLAKQFEQIILQKKGPIQPDFSYAAQTRRVITSEGDFWVINLNPKDPVRLLLERIRNEAHRFAVRYHTKLKRGHIKSTELTKIPGIGAETARKLLITFGSVSGVKSAPHNQLASAVGNIKAKNIERYFSKSKA